MKRYILTFFALFLTLGFYAQKEINTGIETAYEPSYFVQFKDQSFICLFQDSKGKTKAVRLNSDGELSGNITVPKNFKSQVFDDSRWSLQSEDNMHYSLYFYNGLIEIVETSKDLTQVTSELKDKRLFETYDAEAFINQIGNPTWIRIGIDDNKRVIRQVVIELDIQTHTITVNEYTYASLGEFDKKSGIVYIGKRNGNAIYAVATNLRSEGNFKIKIVHLKDGVSEVITEFEDKIDNGYSYHILPFTEVFGDEEILKFYIAITPDLIDGPYLKNSRNLGFKVYKNEDNNWSDYEFSMPAQMTTNDYLKLDLCYSTIFGEEYYFVKPFHLVTDEGVNNYTTIFKNTDEGVIATTLVAPFSFHNVPAQFDIFDEYFKNTLLRTIASPFENENSFKFILMSFKTITSETNYLEFIDIPKK